MDMIRVLECYRKQIYLQKQLCLKKFETSNVNMNSIFKIITQFKPELSLIWKKKTL